QEFTHNRVPNYEPRTWFAVNPDYTNRTNGTLTHECNRGLFALIFQISKTLDNYNLEFVRSAF
uniref:Peptidase_M14 domain-containing protein n=1 Tax=Mesocestoides corti TaxID=53468 RepID=A0A5K3FSK5_MESCO